MTSLAARLINETTFKGLYVNCKLTDQSAADLNKLVAQYLPQDLLAPAYDYHVTIMYAKDFSIDMMTAQQIASTSTIAETPRTGFCEEVVWWAGHDNKGYVVCKVKSDSLNAIHNKWKDAGAKHSFEDYVAHITIATGLPDPETSDVKGGYRNLRLSLRRAPITLTFQPEDIAPLNKD